MARYITAFQHIDMHRIVLHGTGNTNGAAQDSTAELHVVVMPSDVYVLSNTLA